MDEITRFGDKSRKSASEAGFDLGDVIWPGHGHLGHATHELWGQQRLGYEADLLGYDIAKAAEYLERALALPVDDEAFHGGIARAVRRVISKMNRIWVVVCKDLARPPSRLTAGSGAGPYAGDTESRQRFALHIQTILTKPCPDEISRDTWYFGYVEALLDLQYHVVEDDATPNIYGPVRAAPGPSRMAWTAVADALRQYRLPGAAPTRSWDYSLPLANSLHVATIRLAVALDDSAKSALDAIPGIEHSIQFDAFSGDQHRPVPEWQEQFNATFNDLRVAGAVWALLTNTLRVAPDGFESHDPSHSHIEQAIQALVDLQNRYASAFVVEFEPSERASEESDTANSEDDDRYMDSMED